MWQRSWLGAVVASVAMLLAMSARADSSGGGAPESPTERSKQAVSEEPADSRLPWLKKHDESVELGERAIASAEKALGPDHPNLATLLNNFATLLYEQGDYARAERLFQRAISIRERTQGPDHIDLAAPLDNLGAVSTAQGDYGRAARLHQRALAIRESALGPSHPDVAFSLNNLGALYAEQGEYAEALPLLQRALSIRESALRPDDPLLASSLDNVATLYSRLGDDARAEPLFRRALSIREGSLAKNHPDIAYSCSNLAGTRDRQGDSAEAEGLYRRALSIGEEALGPNHPDVATLANNLAVLYEERGDYERAEQLYRRAQSIRERALGPDHPDVAASLNNLAVLYEAQGDYARAEPLFERARSILEATLGPQHPDYASLLMNFAKLRAAQGRVDDAITLSVDSADVEDGHAMSVLTFGSEAQKRAYVVTHKYSVDWPLSLHIHYAPADARAAALAVSSILRRKGRVLDAVADSFAAIRSRLTAEDQALLDRLSAVRARLGSALLRRPEGIPIQLYRGQIQAFKEEQQKLEEEISKRSADIHADRQIVTLAQVQEAIPDSAALIEIARYEPFNANATTRIERHRTPRYAAYAIRRRGEPVYVDLGEAAPIDEAAAALHDALADKDLTHNPKPAARALDTLIMQRIRALLGEARWIFLSPDGALNLVPFEALVDEQDRFLVERYAFTYLTSGRDLVRLKGHAASRQKALIVAAPAFDATGAPGPASGAEANTHRGLRSTDMTGIRFPPLPDAAVEAEAIHRDLPEALVLSGEEATEAAVKAANGPLILHFATHGFFLPDQPEGSAETSKRSAQALEPGPEEVAAALQRESPLLRAGLALAGANARASGEADDGVLTALEASSLDLHGTKLVVLSACETGLGEAVSGEGVYGLRRAFVMAGAETQVMSLWKVDSGRTRDMMIAYYDKLRAGRGRSEALREVQLEMLKNEETSHPNLWAAFIVSGDWRALDGSEVAPDFTRPRPGARACSPASPLGSGRESYWFIAGSASLLLGMVARGRRLRGRDRIRSRFNDDSSG